MRFSTICNAYLANILFNHGVSAQMTAQRFSASVTFSGVSIFYTFSIGGNGVIGSSDGQGINSSFNYPGAIVVSASNVVYIADKTNQNIRMINTSGYISTIAGVLGSAGSNNGAALSATFNAPLGITTDIFGNLLISDTNNDVIRYINLTSNVVSTYAGTVGSTGTTNGPALTTARFTFPFSVYGAPDGRVYVCDTYSYQIRVISTAKDVTLLAGSTSGSVDGQGSNAQFGLPRGVTQGNNQTLLVVDITTLIRSINASGYVSTLAGSVSGFLDGPKLSARFGSIYSAALAPDGTIFVADFGNNRIRRIDYITGMVSTVCGNGSSSTVNGNSAVSTVFQPRTIAVGPDGVVYFADIGTQTIRKMVELKAPIIQSLVSTSISNNGVYNFTLGLSSVYQTSSVNSITLILANSTITAYSCGVLSSTRVSCLASPVPLNGNNFSVTFAISVTNPYGDVQSSLPFLYQDNTSISALAAANAAYTSAYNAAATSSANAAATSSALSVTSAYNSAATSLANAAATSSAVSATLAYNSAATSSANAAATLAAEAAAKTFTSTFLPSTRYSRGAPQSTSSTVTSTSPAKSKPTSPPRSKGSLLEKLLISKGFLVG